MPKPQSQPRSIAICRFIPCCCWRLQRQQHQHQRQQFASSSFVPICFRRYKLYDKLCVYSVLFLSFSFQAQTLTKAAHRLARNCRRTVNTLITFGCIRACFFTQLLFSKAEIIRRELSVAKFLLIVFLIWKTFVTSLWLARAVAAAHLEVLLSFSNVL